LIEAQLGERTTRDEKAKKEKIKPDDKGVVIVKDTYGYMTKDVW
jgi:hypothetical protein